MRIVFIEMALGAALLTSAAQASGPGFTTEGVITAMDASGSVVEVTIPNASPSPMGCSGSTAGLYRISTSANNYSVIVSLLTTAYATGKPVILFNNSCDTDNTPLLSAVYIEP